MKYISKFIQIVFFTLLILVSCKKNKNQANIKGFPVSQKLKGIPLTNVRPYYPHKIMIEDSLLIILNRKGKNFFQIYNTKSLNLLVEFGSNGRGPGEFNEPAFINQKNHINRKPYHLVYDTGTKRISYINFNDFVKNNATIVNQENLSKKMGDPDRFVFYSDTLSITVPGDGVKGRFQIFKNDSVETVTYLPKLPFNIHRDNYYPLYVNKSSVLNKERNKIVATTSMLGQYDFFDFSGNLLYSSIINRDKNLKKNVSSSMEIKNPERLFYQTEMKSVGNLIYSIYYKYKSTEGSSLAKSRIHVLDWNGNLIKEYLLDKLILSFAYDNINNCFYGVAPYEEEYQIIKYNIE